MYSVVGATGKVGCAAIRELRARDQPVRAIVRDPGKATFLNELNCEIAVADLEQPETLTRALADSEAVQVICPMLLRHDDAMGAMKAFVDTIVAALSQTRPTSVVAISDYGAQHPSGTGLTVLFHYFEARLGELDTRLTLLRSSEQMDNWARVAAFAAKTGALPTMHQPLTKRFPTVAARDVGVIAAALLQDPAPGSGPRIVHVEGPRRYTPTDVAAAVSQAAGREVVAREIPRTQWHAALTGGGMGTSYADLVVELYDAHNAGRIDAEDGVGEIRHGETPLEEVFAAFSWPG